MIKLTEPERARLINSGVLRMPTYQAPVPHTREGSLNIGRSETPRKCEMAHCKREAKLYYDGYGRRCEKHAAVVAGRSLDRYYRKMEGVTPLPLPLSKEERRIISNAAHAAGMRSWNWIRKVALEAAKP